ncbi:DHBP synthase RibB-like alpha/beta domain-containing protein, partial [Ochromonadaceae sp. CCMP2298]
MLSTRRTLLLSHRVGLQLRAVASLVGFDEQSIAAAGASLRAGELVAFPTETVYGLGADALNATAVQRIFVAKGRPNTDPLIVHVTGTEAIWQLSSGSALARSVCSALCGAFWPGPLTIIYRASACVPLLVTAGTGFVGLRSPQHPTARALLSAAGVPVAAPSANRFGHVSPTCAQHVLDDL